VFIIIIIVKETIGPTTTGVACTSNLGNRAGNNLGNSACILSVLELHEAL